MENQNYQAAPVYQGQVPQQQYEQMQPQYQAQAPVPQVAAPVQGEKQKNGIFFDVPRKLPYDKDSTRHFKTKAGKELVSVTLPPNFHAMDVNGQMRDLSYMNMICSAKQVFENEYQGEKTNYLSILQSDEVTNQKTGETSKFAIKFSKDLGHYENPEGQTKEEKGAWISEGKLEAHVHPEQMVVASQNYKAAQQQWFQQAHPELMQQQGQQQTQQQAPQQQQQYVQVQPQYQQVAPQQVAPVYDRPVTYLGNKEPNFVNEAARKEFEKSVAPQSLSQRASQATKASDAQEKSAPAQVKGAVELG